MSENEFNMFITSERISYKIYAYMVLNDIGENVDTIFEFNGIDLYYTDLQMPTYYKIYELLKNEYDINMLELRFSNEKEKQKVINYINYIETEKDIDNNIKI